MAKGVYRSLEGQTIICAWCGRSRFKGHPNKLYCGMSCLKAAAKDRRMKRAIDRAIARIAESLTAELSRKPRPEA